MKHLDSTTKSQEGVGKGIYGMTLQECNQQNQDCETLGQMTFFFQQINCKEKKGKGDIRNLKRSKRYINKYYVDFVCTLI